MQRTRTGPRYHLTPPFILFDQEHGREKQMWENFTPLVFCGLQVVSTLHIQQFVLGEKLTKAAGLDTLSIFKILQILL